MNKEDWKVVAKWIGLAYLPIMILVIIVFFLVQWQMKKVDEVREMPLQATSALE